MKIYLITTGILFALMTAVHILRAAVEWPHNGLNAPFIFGMTPLILLPAALSGWAWFLLRKPK